MGRDKKELHELICISIKDFSKMPVRTQGLDAELDADTYSKSNPDLDPDMLYGDRLPVGAAGPVACRSSGCVIYIYGFKGVSGLPPLSLFHSRLFLISFNATAYCNNKWFFIQCHCFLYLSYTSPSIYVHI